MSADEPLHERTAALITAALEAGEANNTPPPADSPLRTFWARARTQAYSVERLGAELAAAHLALQEIASSSASAAQALAGAAAFWSTR